MRRVGEADPRTAARKGGFPGAYLGEGAIGGVGISGLDLVSW